MKSHRVVLALALFLLPSVARAQPAVVPYSGRLTDGTGWGQSTQLDLRVKLYDADVGGNLVFEGLHPATPVVDGYFTVNLGMCDAQGYCDPNPANAEFPTALPPQLFITVQVGDGPEMQPRQPVGSIPYALVARQLSESGLSSLDSRYVNEGQTSAITSGMIANGQVSNAHIAPDAAIEFSKLSGVAAAGHNHDGAYLKNTGGDLSGSLTVAGPVTIGSEQTQANLYVRGLAWIGRYGKGAESDALWLGQWTVEYEPNLKIQTRDDGGTNYIRFHGTRWMTIFNFSHDSPNGMVTEMTISDGVQIRGGLNIGGNCQASGSKNCDIAEAFLSLDGAGPGDVVSLDPSRFKAMRLADRPYDPMLAGVVSTEPTLLMGQNDVPEGVAIALAGVVPVKVTLENGPIAVGDLLTSSSTPGHAMRADRPGPVIGKAMEPFDGGQGWTGRIRMLVAPQTCSDPADMQARVEALEATVRGLTERLDRLSRRCGSGEDDAK